MAYTIEGYLRESQEVQKIVEFKRARFKELFTVLDEKSHAPDSSFNSSQVSNVVGHMINANKHSGELIWKIGRHGEYNVFLHGAYELYKRAGMFVGTQDTEYGELFTELGSLIGPVGDRLNSEVAEERQIPETPVRHSMHLYHQLGKWADARIPRFREPDLIDSDSMIGFPQHGSIFRAGQIADWLLSTPPNVKLGT